MEGYRLMYAELPSFKVTYRRNAAPVMTITMNVHGDSAPDVEALAKMLDEGVPTDLVIRAAHRANGLLVDATTGESYGPAAAPPLGAQEAMEIGDRPPGYFDNG